jgi:hypothetical protein
MSGNPNAASLDVVFSSPTISVYSPDGLTYAVVPAEQLMVFEPDGLIASYDIAPVVESSYVICPISMLPGTNDGVQPGWIVVRTGAECLALLNRSTCCISDGGRHL